MPPAATCLFWTLSKKPILLLFVFSPKRSRQISFGCEVSQGQFLRTISLTLFAGRTETNSSLKMHAYLRFLLCARWGQKIGRKAEREREAGPYLTTFTGQNEHVRFCSVVHSSANLHGQPGAIVLGERTQTVTDTHSIVMRHRWHSLGKDALLFPRKT